MRVLIDVTVAVMSLSLSEGFRIRHSAGSAGYEVVEMPRADRSRLLEPLFRTYIRITSKSSRYSNILFFSHTTHSNRCLFLIRETDTVSNVWL